MVEVEGQNAEGQKIKAALVSLKPSTLPSVSTNSSPSLTWKDILHLAFVWRTVLTDLKFRINFFSKENFILNKICDVDVL